MYIKEVRIHGFKSYREKTVCGPLSPMHNSIVGFNGAGKTLRFVLSEQSATLRPEERSKLLNEGAGASVLSAYVEIVFDNTDRRIDSERDEVIIKRQIGLKKDEYSVDGKHVSRTEISNILETAGFSKSNPYYIVEQGKVTAITVMKDSERLALIKDVAGTNVYEEKKAESEKILNDSIRKMDEIRNNLGMIESRLEKLDKEKEELSEYYALDKERRSLHHALLTKRIQVLRDKLSELEKKKHQLRTDSGQDSQNHEELEASKEVLERSLDDLRERLRVIEQDKKVLTEEEDRQFEAENSQQEEVNRSVRDVEQKNSEVRAKNANITKLQNAVTKLEKELEQMEPEIALMKEQQDRTKKEFNRVDAERVKLQSMASKSDYANQAERDKALNIKMKEVQDLQRRYQSMNQDIKREIDTAAKRKLECECEMKKIEGRTAEFEKAGEKHSKAREELRRKEVEIANKIREQQKKQEECKKETSKLKTDLGEVDKKLDNGMPNGSARALRFLNDYCKKENVQGYYGPLIDLIQCNERFYTAVEQVGGRQMFNAVVDDENVATRLINAMKAAKPGSAGRMSFMPLSKLRPQKTNFPATLQDAEPLVDRIKCDDKFKVAVAQVFGSALLCKDLDVANKYRKEYDLECVTMDGDKVQRKGAIKGGYHDHTSSKLKLNKEKSEKRKLQVEKEGEEAAAAQEYDTLVQAQQQTATDKQHLEKEEQAVNKEKRDNLREAQNLKREVAELVQFVKDKEYTLASNTTNFEENQQEIDKLNELLKLPFSQTITEEQKEQLLVLTQQHTQLHKTLQNEQESTANLERKRSNTWQEKLRTVNDLESLHDSVSRLQSECAQMSRDLEMEQHKLAELRKQKQVCAENSTKKEQEQKDVKADLNRQEEELRQVRNKLKSQKNAADKIHNQLSSIAADREKCQKDMESYNKQLLELGSLPEAFDKYKGLKETELNDRLVKVTNKLGKFKNVNKKAMDQFNQFTDQVDKEKFQVRMKELKQGEDSIRKLIENLDAKKDNALQTTFRMVSKHFSEVFKNIVPGGEGRLIMKTKDGMDGEGEDEDGGGPSSHRGQYTGIGVEVRFAAGEKVSKMRELSGGQKCVVALTIIFAIQRCDPAPFYLFDEVDAALDPLFRGAVANMITQQKKVKDGDSGCQFLTSSFHEELVKAADQHWLVSHTGMSRITRGDVQQQLTIVRKNQSSANAGRSAR